MIIQKRPYELITYLQLSPGDAGYEDPATVYLMVDKTGWSEPKKISLADFLMSNHIETQTTSPTSINFSVTYGEEFLSSNYYFELQVYKIVTIPNVGNVRQTVKYHSLTPTVSGFSFTLDKYESGIIITYLAFESAISSSLSKDYIYATGVVASLVIPNTGKVQITGFTSIINSGITLASNEFTVGRTGIYEISIGGATLNESAQNLLSLDVYDDADNPLGITRQFLPRADYDPFGVIGMISLSASDVVRFYLSAPATGLTIDLSTITVNIKQL